ncbi:MAG: hypothetical protein MUF04_14085 [Akkermansiaceae bacterium]|jgi:hypothetical protein|nr:hypothetical protein [Akkermansiaceae bacterium]
MPKPPAKPEFWHLSKALASGILHDRAARRKLLSRLLVAVLAVLAVGNWPLRDWLGSNIWRFVLWWGACAALTGFLLLLAFYDALAVVGEEREKLKKQLNRDDDQPGR